jgi:DNA-binding transcriptional regulator LsrR (DeoR family)
MDETLNRRIRLAEAAQRYYVEGWSQDAVAELLGTSRSNVSRLLDTARKEGVVRFVIDHPLQRHTALEAELQGVFGLSEAIVLTGPDPSLRLVGAIAARRLVELLEDTSRVAIGWGRTVEAVIDNVAVDTPMNIEVVQVGGDLTMAPAASGHELVRRLAQALGGRNRFLHAPAVLTSESVASELRSDPRIALELSLAKAADLALVGIGIPGVGFAEKAVADSYRGTQSPAAVIAARLVDDNGVELEGPLRERVIAIGLEDLIAIPTAVGVAAGSEKGRAVAAALRGGLVDVLVCDQPAAATALSHIETGAHHAKT